MSLRSRIPSRSTTKGMRVSVMFQQLQKVALLRYKRAKQPAVFVVAISLYRAIRHIAQLITGKARARRLPGLQGIGHIGSQRSAKGIPLHYFILGKYKIYRHLV